MPRASTGADRARLGRGAAALLGVAAALVLASGAGAASASDWSVTTTFKAKSPTCSAKFPVPKGSPTLTIEAHAPKGSSQLAALFSVGGLPPLLAGKTGTIRDLRISIGKSWAADGLKADWAKGSSDSNSKMAIYAAPAVATVLQPIAGGGQLVITVPLTGGTRKYAFDLGGSVTPMQALVECLRKWG